MSKQRNRNSLLSSHNRSSYTNSTKDELLFMKYSMTKPELPLYPLNDYEYSGIESRDSTPVKDGLKDGQVKDEHLHIHQQANPTPSNHVNSSNELTYPDFKPWKDPNQLSEDQKKKELGRLNNQNYLNKGYFETPIVSNEYYSARTLIQATIFSSTDNCNNVLKELSQHLANGYNTRNEVINKIRFNSNNFKIPPRVTLTISKKESWLKDLANPKIPLSKIAEKLPHGIRNKVLIESVSNKNVPISRAIWFTKCVLYGELITLRRKHLIRSSTSGEDFEIHWLKEWTQQVSDYIYKFSKEMINISTSEKKEIYMGKLAYLLQYVQTLYVECLLDKSFFLSLILKFLKEGLPLNSKNVAELVNFSRNESEENTSQDLGWAKELDINFGSVLVSLTLIKIFWNDILKFDYMCKELSELLLLNHYFILKLRLLRSKTETIKYVSETALPDTLASKVLQLISDHVTYLFEFNTNVFILPNYWILIHDSLYKILKDGENFRSEKENAEIQKQLELIKYRNESLVLNMRHSASLAKTNQSGPFTQNSDVEESDHTFINRSSNDVLRFIQQLDELKLGDLASLLRPDIKQEEAKDSTPGLTPSYVSPGAHSNPSETITWRTNLSILIHWSITSFRSAKESSENILIICNFLKRHVLHQNTPKGNKTSQNLKVEFENEILEIIYAIVESKTSKIIDYNLFVLINELYQLKIITISSYVRKLIASGIFYLSSDDDKISSEQDHLVQTHLRILQNLPVLNNRQCDSILKKWTPNGFNFRERFEGGREVLEKEIVGLIQPSNQRTGYSGVRDPSNPSHPLHYIYDLKVGLKFLLVNWITTELKSTITKSPKLIHITPSTITDLYEFYSLCDNLTVFFKVLIKFILRNEGGVIIFYTDTLYLITRLIIRHFKLIKFMGSIPGQSGTGGAESSGYELFKLIVLNYKDLSTREFDYFKFDQVWKFIDTAIEKHQIEPTSVTKTQRGLGAEIETDSPMKFNEKSDSKNHEYAFLNFREDLEELLNSSVKFLPDSEVRDIHTAIGINLIKSEDTEMEVSNVENLKTLLSHYFDNLETISEDDESLLIKSLVNTQNIITLDSDAYSFTNHVSEFLSSLFNNSETEKLSLFVKKLVLFEIIRINDLIVLLRDKSLDNLIYTVVFRDSKDESLSLSQTLLLNLIRDAFRFRYSVNFTFSIFEGLKENDSIFASTLWINFESQVLDFLNHLAVTNTKLFADQFIPKISQDDSILLLNKLLKTNQDTQVESLGDFRKIANQVEEFNLPSVQLLIRVICSKDLNGLESHEVYQKLRELVEAFISHSHFGFTIHNSFFGEIFNYMVWAHKVTVLNILEDFVLTNTRFEEGVSLMGGELNEIDFLPVLNDFFKKFSTSSISILESSGEFFQKLSDFLEKLVNLTSGSEDISLDLDESQKIGTPLLFSYQSEAIANTISIFLRMLIIHKATLTKRIVSYDSDQFLFIKNLISLLNSKFLEEGNEKLRILLYDLLLLLKTAITELLNVNAESEMMQSTSPGYIMGSIAETPKVEDWSTTPGASGMSGGGTAVTPGGGIAVTPGAISAVTPGVPVPVGSSSLHLATVFNLPEPTQQNPFKEYLDPSRINCILTLDEYELQQAGDVHVVNDSNLVLIPAKPDSSTLTSAFGILANPPQSQSVKPPPCYPYKMRSFEVLEDSSPALNDACINLQLFDAYTTRENPP